VATTSLDLPINDGLIFSNLLSALNQQAVVYLDLRYPEKIIRASEKVTNLE